MSLVATRTETGRIWVVRPNQSLSAVGRNLVFCVTAAGSTAIAFAFSYVGAWPVLPFTGLELAALWFALRHNRLSADDFERIELEPERLTIETRRGALSLRHEWQPYWVRLEYVLPPERRSHRLLLRSHGKALEVGRLLTEEQKVALATELKRGLGAVCSGRHGSLRETS